MLQGLITLTLDKEKTLSLTDQENPSRMLQAFKGMKKWDDDVSI